MAKKKIQCFRLPELVEGSIVCIAMCDGSVVSDHRADRESGIQEALGCNGSLWHHNVYDRVLGRDMWTIEWIDNPTLDMLTRARATLELPISNVVAPNEKTADDLIEPLIPVVEVTTDWAADDLIDSELES